MRRAVVGALVLVVGLAAFAQGQSADTLLARVRQWLREHTESVNHPVFGPSGTGHSKGMVPDPGAIAGTSLFLREDGTWAAASGGVSDGDKGDITVSASGATWTIDGDVVTFAKMQNLTTQRVIGRNTGGSGDPEEVTASQVLDWIGSTRGSILYRGASGWAILPPGTSGDVLVSNGAGADPSYTPGSGLGSGLTHAQVMSRASLTF